MSEIDQAQQTMHFLMTQDDIPQEFIMSEAINEAAFGNDQQLGKPHGCPVLQIPNMTRPIIQDWYQAHMIQNPQGLVLGGAGIDHETLVQLGQQYFGHLQQQPEQLDEQQGRIPMIPSQYRGGSKVVTLPTPIDGGHDLSPEQYSVVQREKRLTRVAVGLEIGGWHSDNLVPICVLQSLLGGGSSFSAGGPGKGMYSRLYRQILNRYHWAESAEAFTSFHNEAGLVGITGRADAKYTMDMVKTFCIHLKRLAVEPVSEEELDRARNMLRNDVMTQLESRFVLFEDMARQVLTFGKREHVSETVAKIDAVTAEQIQAIIAQAIMKPPTVTAVGVDVQNVPSYEQVCELIRR
jgi:processing peptidase subunit alpha